MSLIDVSEIMTDPDFVVTVTVRRPTAPTFSNEGVATYGYLPDQSITAIVQSATPADLKSLPEGVNLQGVVSVWSGTQIKIGDQSGKGSDVIVYQGVSYRVRSMDDRSDNGYWRVLAERFIP